MNKILGAYEHFFTAWKVSKYGVLSGPYLDTFHAVFVFLFALHISEAHPEIS